jgi:CBS domain containing-hemolysin-like protein
MTVLMGLSAFFSGSEAALFYLRPADRRQLARGNLRDRVAVQLLSDPDRLLSAVLFWNLVVNIMYFALSSLVALRLDAQAPAGSVAAISFAVGSLVTIIFFSEMLPKSLAVMQPIVIARLVSLPLSVAVRITDPVMPLLQFMTRISRRLLWAGFQSEPYMELADLERAIQISSDDQSIIRQEQTVLNNIVKLSDIRVDEWMRPRAQFRIFRPPVSLAGLQGSLPPSGYLLLTEPDSDEIARAFPLRGVTRLASDVIDAQAQPVLYLPWKATVADALEGMAQEQCHVTTVVNEFGETIGVLTLEDVLATVFMYEPSRSKRLLDLNPIHRISAGRWAVSGIMGLKQLLRYFGETEMPDTRSVTVAGVIQEQMQRLAQPGDECRWGPFTFRVVEAPQADNLLVELHYHPAPGEVTE